MEKPQERHTAKVRFVAAMQQGLSWQEARQEVGLCLSRSTVFRLRQRVYLMGAEAAQDGRHGHPVKLRGEVRQWLEETCRQAPHTPSHQIQALLVERFALSVSVSQLNRVRAALGLSNPPQSAKKKRAVLAESRSGRRGQEPCCYWLLLTKPTCFPSWK